VFDSCLLLHSFFSNLTIIFSFQTHPNPELDQMGGRFSPNSGRFGIIVCRSIENLDLFLSRCRDSHNAGRGTIIPLVDEDVLNILDQIKIGVPNATETFLAERLRRVILG
ncbi:hypothetical protein Q5741_21270, partial [Paenibacillus sp. JX-17]|nr:hypothetical protein [Paenibacillus sp. JX-17]